MPELGRSAGLTGLIELVREAGLDPFRLAAEAHVPRAALTDPEIRIPSAAITRLIELAGTRTGFEDFGLRMVDRRRLSTMGALGLAVRHQLSLRRAFEVIRDYGWLLNDNLKLDLEDAGGTTLLRIAPVAWRRQVSEFVVGLLFRAAQALRGPAWKPLEVSFMHSAPSSLESHRRFFGMTPLYDQNFLGMLIETEDLDRQIPGADASMAAETVRYLEHMSAGRGRELRDKVSELIQGQLSDGGVSVDRVAERIGLDRRTLHRRLAAEGTTYSELLMTARRRLAENLVAYSDRTLQDVADSLGFSSVSVFAHWFRRNFGCTASAYRAQQSRAAAERRPAAVA